MTGFTDSGRSTFLKSSKSKGCKRPQAAIEDRNSSVAQLLGESLLHRDDHVVRGLFQFVECATYEPRVISPESDKPQ